MGLWLLLTICTAWLALCALAVSLCVAAARADRASAALTPRLRAVPADRPTVATRPLRGRREPLRPATRPNVTRLPR
jgi:hypothetical protein